MRCGISTACFFSRMFTEDALLFMAENGVRSVELFLNSYCEYTPKFVAALAATAQSYDMRVESIHPMTTQFEPQLFSLCSRQRSDANNIFDAVLSAAKTLGAKKYIMHGPSTMGGVLKNAQLERVGPIADELAEKARAYGVALCWENVSWCMFNSPLFPKRLAEYSHSDNLYFCLDIKQAIRSGYSPFDYFDAMGGRLAHVHLLDYTQSENGLKLKMPFEGEFDFARLKTALQGIGYDGALILECYSDLYAACNEVISSHNRLCRAYL